MARLSRKSESEILWEKLTKIKGPGAEPRMMNVFITDTFSKLDPQLQARSMRLVRKLLDSFKRVLPNADPQLIGDTVAHLDSLWDTSQGFDKTLKNICQLKSPRHAAHLKHFLIEIEAQQIDLSLWWIKQLKRLIPKLQEAAEREARRQRRRRKSN